MSATISHPIPSLPFAHLNLRFNPFGLIPDAQRAELAVVDVSRFVRRLQTSGYAVQFLGEKGHGKTTRLLAIREHFDECGYVHFGEGERPAIPDGNPLLIDEMQRVPRRKRRRVYRTSVPLAIGTHEDVGEELTTAGYEVETVRLDGRLEPESLQQILERRIEHARRAPGPVPRIQLDTARQLIDRFGGDVRAIESYLYEVFQDLPGVEDV